jgi:hypothetical protein
MNESINLDKLNRELTTIKQSMVTRRELEQLLETIAVLSNKDTMTQIEKSEEDIKNGRIKKVFSVADL